MADSDVWQEAVKGVRRLRTNRHTDDIEPKEIKIRKDKENCYQLLAAMISFVAADIVRGYLSVGGQTAIGRGIFEGNGPVTGTISEQDMELYKKQLASMIQEGVC